MCPASEASNESVRRLGSYTTAKITAGRVERVERHVARLRRDAGRLGLPLPPRAAIEDLFLTCAAKTFGKGDGIVRIEWSHLPSEAPELIATPRAYADAGSEWRAATSKTVHPGPEFRANTKYVDVSAYDLGRAEIKASELNEVLLYDANGHLVEGAASNFLVVTRDDRITTPARDLGPVEGLGLTVLRDSHPEIQEAHLTRQDIATCQELMSTNGVRGLVPITHLDDHPINNGQPGPIAKALGATFNA